MNIYAMAGDKIRCVCPDNCVDHEIEHALLYLKLDYLYTVDYTELFSDHTNVFLREVPGPRFNAILFEDAAEHKRPDLSWAQIEGMLMSVTHDTLLSQEFKQGTPMGELEQIRRYYYEFTMLYRYYCKTYLDPAYASKTALRMLKGRNHLK